MATKGVTNPTLSDVAKRLDPNGAIDDLVDILAESNDVIDDMTVIEGNLPTGHKSTIVTGYPDATWRMLNYGVPNSKGRTAQVTDTCGMLETYAEIDASLAGLNGNDIQWRLGEDKLFINTMNRTMQSSLFYSNSTVNPQQPHGLSPRFSTYSSDTENIGSNIIKAGGSSNNTSIWLVGWSPQTVFSFYPKGSKAGLQITDKTPGNETVTLKDADGNQYEGLRTHYKWDIGFGIRNWKYIARIANIDVTALTKNASAGADLLDLMVQALELMPSESDVRLAFYCNRTIRSFLRRQVLNKISYTLTSETVAGKRKVVLDGVPVNRCERILSTETTVS